MKTQDILNTLPGSWEELKLKDFLKVLQVEITEQDDLENLFIGFSNTFAIISALTGVSVDELEAMPLNDSQKLAKKVGFISNWPEEKKKGVIQVKKVEEITYNDFLLFNTYLDKPFEHMPELIKAFSKNNFTEEEILDLSMAEVHTGFFTLRQAIKKWSKRSMRTTSNRMIDLMNVSKARKVLLRSMLRTNKRLLQSVSSTAGTYLSSQ